MYTLQKLRIKKQHNKLKIFQYENGYDASPTLYPNTDDVFEWLKNGDDEMRLDLERLIQSPKISTTNIGQDQIPTSLLQQLSPVQQQQQNIQNNSQQQQQQQKQHQSNGMFDGNVYNLNVQVL